MLPPIVSADSIEREWRLRFFLRWPCGVCERATALLAFGFFSRRRFFGLLTVRSDSRNLKRVENPRKGDIELIKSEFSVVINRPVEEVFAFANDLESDPQWMAAVSERKKTSEGPVGVGTTFHDTGTLLGRKVENNYEVTEYEPNAKLGIKTISGSIPIEATSTCEPVEGGTRFTMAGAADVAGIFKFAEPFVTRIMKRELEADLANLKDLLEAQV